MTILDSSVSSRPVVLLHPGPRPHWIGGHLSDFNRDPLTFLTHLAREYGDVVALKFGGFSVLFLNHPAAIGEVLVTHNRQFIKGRGLGRTRDLLGNGLLTSEGEFWRRQRRLAQPAFHHQRIAAYGEIMSSFTDQMLAGWHTGQTLDVHEEMMALTMAIVARALFNTDVTREAGEVSSAMNTLLMVFNQRNQQFLIPEWVPTPSKRRLEQAIQMLDRIVYRIIAERRDNPGKYNDLLATLLAARDEQGAGMTDQQLRDEVMTLFLAGHETTANALSWTWMLLAQNPQVEAQLHQELDTVLAGRVPTSADLPALPYTGQVITESMRLYPPAWVIGRQAAEDVDILGIHIPEGTGLIMSQWVMHRDPRFYPNPDLFDPSRWSDDFARQIPEFAYFPFGGGPRLCIGRPFALQETQLVLAMVAQKYCLRLVDDQKITPQPSITLRPRDGIRMTLERRD